MERCKRSDEPDLVPADCFSRVCAAAPGAPAAAWRTELACLRECYRLLGRDPRYRKLIATMYLGSVVAPGRARMVRALYCFFRRLDDVLDGDLHTGLEPQPYVRRVLLSMKGEGPCDNEPAVLLGSYVVQNLRLIVSDEDHVLRVMGGLLRTMQFDHQRATALRILDEAALIRHLRKVFASSLELALIVSGSAYRWIHFEDLVDAQVRLFTLRDLQKDLSRCLINLPADALGMAPGTMQNTTNIDRLIAFNRVSHWIEKQYALGEESLAAAGRAFRACQCRRTRLILSPVYSDLKHICSELSTRLPPGSVP